MRVALICITDRSQLIAHRIRPGPKIRQMNEWTSGMLRLRSTDSAWGMCSRKKKQRGKETCSLPSSSKLHAIVASEGVAAVVGFGTEETKQRKKSGKVAHHFRFVDLQIYARTISFERGVCDMLAMPVVLGGMVFRMRLD